MNLYWGSLHKGSSYIVTPYIHQRWPDIFTSNRYFSKTEEGQLEEKTDF